MSTRVIGRGICPKCNEEGSVVFKELYGKIYVYFKHGRRWCYIGPLEKVDLQKLIISLKTYHTFTTKFADQLKNIIGEIAMRLTYLVISIAILFTAAYTLSIPPERYSTIVFSITMIANILLSFTIAIYEKTYKEKSYTTLKRTISRSYVLYLFFTLGIFYLTLIVTYPLACPIKMRFYCKIPVQKPSITIVNTPKGVIQTIDSVYITHEMIMPLTSIITSAIILAILARPLNRHKMILHTILTPLVAYATLTIIPFITFLKIANISTILTYLLITTPSLTIITTLSSLAFIMLMNFFRKLMSLPYGE